MRITSSRSQASASGSDDDDRSDAPLPAPLPTPAAASQGPSQRPARQAALLEQFSAATIVSRSAADYLAEWQAWVADGGTTGGNRAEALRRMAAYLKNGANDAELELTELGLTSLPENLPPHLQILNVSRNKLSDLPARLPASIVRLYAFDNRLTVLPPQLPSALTWLTVSRNRLIALPDRLPAGLTRLYAATNQLISLPDRLPTSLQHLDLGNNQLRSLPESLFAALTEISVSNNYLTTMTHALSPAFQPWPIDGYQMESAADDIVRSLRHYRDIRLDNNPLSTRVTAHLNAIVNADDYAGPRVMFSMAWSASSLPVRPLQDAIADWYEDSTMSAENCWTAIAQEDGATAFSIFLDRLRGTVNTGNPDFRRHIVAWLDCLGTNATLRRDSFAISVGAGATCEDRVSLTLNDMKKAVIVADVQAGRYNHRLPDLIALARGMFRLDQLELIARRKVASLHFVDEIEVYLAYQVKLRDTLRLPLEVNDMRFFAVSWVSQKDLDEAVSLVKANEKEMFFRYLATAWTPFQAVIKQLDPALYDDAKSRLAWELEAPFQQRLQQHLAHMGLQDNEDAQHIAGALVKNDIDLEVNGQLATDFIAKHNLSQWLDWPW